MSSAKDQKWARKKILKETGREPKDAAEVEARIALRSAFPAIPLQVDTHSRSTALTLVETPKVVTQSTDWLAAPWDNKNPLYVMTKAHVIATSEKPGRRSAMMQLHLQALHLLLRPYMQADAMAAAEWGSDIFQASAELSAIGAGDRSTWFEPVRPDGAKAGDPKITRALRSAIILTVCAAECEYRLQAPSQRTYPKAFEKVLTEIRDCIKPWKLDDVFPDGSGGAQTNKHGLKEERVVIARGEILAKLVRRFEKRYRPELRDSDGDADYSAGLYQTNIEIIRSLAVPGLQAHYRTYLRLAANGLKTAAAATEHVIKPRKQRPRRVSAPEGN